MRKISLDNYTLSLEVNDLKMRLKFTFGIIKYLGVSEFEEIPKILNENVNSIRVAKLIINEAIKGYNEGFNASEKPVTEKEVISLCNDIEALKCLSIAVKGIYANSHYVKNDNINICDAPATRPTVDKVIVSAISTIGIPYSDVMRMTFAEVYGYTRAFSELHNSVNDVHIPSGVKIKGVGNVTDLRKIIR